MSGWFANIAVWSAALACAVAAEEPATAVVRFGNGDQLAGRLESLTPERLVWQSPALQSPAPFLLPGVLDFASPAVDPDFPGTHEATVLLTNGDVVRGHLMAVSDDAIQLDTWFAGRMSFNRLMVSEIRIDERGSPVYRGPTGIDGWLQSGDKESWSYRNSTLRSTTAGGIARDVEFPEEASVAFDVAWHGSLNLKVVLYSNNLETDRPSAGYEVSLQQRSVFVRNCQSQKLIGNSQNATELAENEKARIDIRVSTKSGTVCVRVNDRQIDRAWVDPEVAQHIVGKGLHFVGGSAPLQISRIEVTDWDGETEVVKEQPFNAGRPWGMGEMDDEEPAPVAPPKPPGHRMELRNGDSLAGEVTSIEGGMIHVKTPFREVKLPLVAVRSVGLKPVPLERCKRENGDLRAWFPDGSSMVFRLISLEDGWLTGSSQNFGTARFKVSAFSRIEFNIYDPALEEIRKGGL